RLHPTHVLGIFGISRRYTDRRNCSGNPPDPDISSGALLDLVSRQAHKRWAAHPGDSHTVNEHKKFGEATHASVREARLPSFHVATGHPCLPAEMAGPENFPGASQGIGEAGVQ